MLGNSASLCGNCTRLPAAVLREGQTNPHPRLSVDRSRRRPRRRSAVCSSRGTGSGEDTAGSVRYGLNFLQWAGTVVPQGVVVTGVKTGWRAAWATMVTELAPQTSDGDYARPKSSIRSAVPRGSRFDPGQLVLYVGNACPWCHRTTLVLALRGLAGAVRVVRLRDDAERASRGGWVFDAASPDPVFGKRDLREARVGGGELLFEESALRSPLSLVRDAQSRPKRSAGRSPVPRNRCTKPLSQATRAAAPPRCSSTRGAAPPSPTTAGTSARSSTTASRSRGSS